MAAALYLIQIDTLLTAIFSASGVARAVPAAITSAALISPAAAGCGDFYSVDLFFRGDFSGKRRRGDPADLALSSGCPLPGRPQYSLAFLRWGPVPFLKDRRPSDLLAGTPMYATPA